MAFFSFQNKSSDVGIRLRFLALDFVFVISAKTKSLTIEIAAILRFYNRFIIFQMLQQLLSEPQMELHRRYKNLLRNKKKKTFLPRFDLFETNHFIYLQKICFNYLLGEAF